MKSVINNTKQIEIRKSKFIALTFQIHAIEDVNQKLKEVKQMYHDASHYCYAYILDNQEKCSDDGEPSGTAGNPILNVLKKENVNHVLCIVVRYFGGIKLGSGGLIRAYSTACKECLKTTKLEKGYLIVLTFDYDKIKQIEFLLQNKIILQKIFKEKAIYHIQIAEEDYNAIFSSLKQIANIQIIENIFLSKTI